VFPVLAPWWPSQESDRTEIWFVQSFHLGVHMYKLQVNSPTSYETCPANGRQMPRDCIGSWGEPKRWELNIPIINYNVMLEILQEIKMKKNSCKNHNWTRDILFCQQKIDLNRKYFAKYVIIHQGNTLSNIYYRNTWTIHVVNWRKIDCRCSKNVLCTFETRYSIKTCVNKS
jgi:hypothetical protein